MGTFINLLNKSFGRWKVINFIKSRDAGGCVMWLCQCDCGTVRSVSGAALRNGASKSCGCFQKEIASKNMKKLSTKHGKNETRLHIVWTHMKSRCNSHYDKSYHNYGGRGIYICDAWNNDFLSFEDWALNNGYRNGLSIDRIDNNGPYAPENCRWVNNYIQANNKRNNHLITINRIKKTVSQWAVISGINPYCIYKRLKRGWNAEQAVFLNSNTTEGGHGFYGYAREDDNEK